MKHLRLLLALFALIIGGASAGAQTWTPPTIEGEEPVSGQIYKIYNVEAGKGLAMGKAWFGWATTAILDGDGIDFTVNQDGTNWKFIRTGDQGVFTSGNDISGDAMHVDNTAQAYGITKLPNGYYHIHDAGGNENSLCWGYNSSFHTTGVVAHADASAAGWMCDWVFLKDLSAAHIFNARYKLYNLYLKAVAEGANTDEAAFVYNNSNATVEELNDAYTALNQTRYEHKLAIASNNNPQDITEFVLVNADFSAGNIDGWETNYVQWVQADNIGYQGASYTNGNVTISQFIEAWRWSPALGDGYLRQRVSGLPEGKYTLEADAIAADQPGGTLPTGTYLYIEAAGVDYKTQMATASGQPQHFSTQFLSPGGVEVIFGLKTVSTTANWIAADNFVVKFYGVDLSPYATLLAQAVSEANALEGTIPTSAYQELNAIVAENNQTWTTSVDYTNAIAAIQAATEEAKALQAPYSRYNDVKAACKTVYGDLNTAETDAQADAATSAEEIDAAVAVIRQALLAVLPNLTVPEEGIELTNALIDNPSVRLSTDYWTKDGTPNGGYSFGKVDCNETEFYNCNFDFYQNLTLGQGTYEFGVTGFHRAGNHATYFYADEDKILIPGVENSIVNTMEQAETYFNDGNGKVALKFALEGETNDIKIGIVNNDTETDKWTIFRDFTLKYFGSQVDLSIYQDEWEAAVAAANAAIDANPNVTGLELAAVQAAIADAPEQTKASYIEKTNALLAATQAFTAAAPAYNAYVAEKTIAQMIGVEVGEEYPSTAEEAATATNNLKVEESTFVNNNYPVDFTGLVGDLSTWTGSEGTGTNNNQHWSGQTIDYYEQGSNNWGANAWEISYTKTAKLPAGKYMAKVAARGSSDLEYSTLSISATNDIVNLNKKGASGKGIDTDGAANFDEGTFVNNNQGFGWEWEFLPFELTEETEVTFTLASKSNINQRWVSYCDFALLTTTVKTETVTIKSGFTATTYSSEFPLDFTNSGLTAYIITGAENGECITEEVTKVPAGTGVYVEGDSDSGEYIVNVYCGSDFSTTSGNRLVGTGAEEVTITPDDNNTYYMFGKQKDKESFYRVGTERKASAHKAYLAIPGANGAKVLFIVRPNEDIVSDDGGFADGINNVEQADVNAKIYNLNGQRVNNAQKGIYIKNGKKVIIK